MTIDAIIMMVATMAFYILGFAICLRNVFRNQKS